MAPGGVAVAQGGRLGRLGAEGFLEGGDGLLELLLGEEGEAAGVRGAGRGRVAGEGQDERERVQNSTTSPRLIR
jgi:hypothetical protein